jgi:hypothetical protein
MPGTTNFAGSPCILIFCLTGSKCWQASWCGLATTAALGVHCIAAPVWQACDQGNPTVKTRASFACRSYCKHTGGAHDSPVYQVLQLVIHHCQQQAKHRLLHHAAFFLSTVPDNMPRWAAAQRLFCFDKGQRHLGCGCIQCYSTGMTVIQWLQDWI